MSDSTHRHPLGVDDSLRRKRPRLVESPTGEGTVVNLAEPPLPILARVFPTLTPPMLEALCQAGRVVEYPARVTLCREGEVAGRFFLVLDGQVQVNKLLEGELTVINRLERGEHFGDIALLLDLPRTATIITEVPSRIFELERAVFNRLLQTQVEAGLSLARMVIKRFLSQEEKHLLELTRLKRRYQPRVPRVFLSYARADVAFGTRLANDLLRQQIDVWLDLYRLDPGRSLARQVGEALDHAQLMILVLSPASLSSGNVEDEWNYHLDQKKVAIPVLHQPCTLPYRLSKFQAVTFHDTDHDLAVARLVAIVNTQLAPARGARETRD